MKEIKNAICVFDYTIKSEGHTDDTIKEFCKKWGKQWGFQLEQGKENGFKHYQLRISLKTKTRNPPFIEGARISPTCDENKTNLFYVMKEDTKIGNFYCDKDKEVYIPRQFRGINKLFPWQQYIIDHLYDFEYRKINYIYDKGGNKGKSTLSALCELKYNCIDIPAINDCTQLMEIMCNECMDNEIRNPPAVFVDLPRAYDKNTLNGIFSALECIKKGKLSDRRYKNKKYWIDSPQIWVFSNEEPNFDYLTKDRWTIYHIDNQNNLVCGVPVITKHKQEEDPLEWGLPNNNILKLSGTTGTKSKGKKN